METLFNNPSRSVTTATSTTEQHLCRDSSEQQANGDEYNLFKGEERRQEIIAKQNQELLVRILNIMASPSRIDTWNVSYINE